MNIFNLSIKRLIKIALHVQIIIVLVGVMVKKGHSNGLLGLVLVYWCEMDLTKICFVILNYLN